jgi:uncharacterized membrane protein YciS (DUF1049 family)
MSLPFGYIDPGTGSLIVQAIIGFVVGGAFFFRNFFRKLATKIKRTNSGISKGTTVREESGEV